MAETRWYLVRRRQEQLKERERETKERTENLENHETKYTKEEANHEGSE